MQQNKLGAYIGSKSDYAVYQVESCDSTNTRLLEATRSGLSSPTVLWALDQTSGRGRFKRQWCHQKNLSLTFSLLYPLPIKLGRAEVCTLPLIIGVAIIEALSSKNNKLTLKWPNDILNFDKKSGGILIELTSSQAQSNHSKNAIIGIGLNVLCLPFSKNTDQNHGFGSIQSSMASHQAVLFEQLLPKLHSSLTVFENSGFQPFKQAWRQHCQHLKKMVNLYSNYPHDPQPFFCEDIDDDGALLVHDNKGKLVRILNSDISLRKQTQ